MSIFGEFFSSLFATNPAPAPAPSNVDPSVALEQAWDEVQTRAQKLCSNRESEQKKDDPLKHAQRQHEEAQSALCGSILECHQTLKTELDLKTLARLQRLARGHSFPVEEPPNVSLAERIEYFVLRTLFAKCGERAWERLLSLMQTAGLDWPIPPAILYQREAAEVARLMKHRKQELGIEFARTYIGKQIELALGEVEVWGPTYPDPNSWLWTQTSFQATGAGLQLQLYAAAVELWLWRSPELEASIRGRLDRELSSVRSLLKTGLVSLEDSEKVASRSRLVYSTLIPQLVWTHLEPQLCWNGALPHLATLAEGLSMVDPVCGMALTADRVVARGKFAEKTYYFCSESCRHNFEKRPAAFIERREHL